MAYLDSTEYTIQKGDTLWDIAEKAGMSVEELARYNKLKNPNMIRAGSKLYIPSKKGTNTVTPQSNYRLPQEPGLEQGFSPLDLVGGFGALGAKGIRGLGNMMAKKAPYSRIDPNLGLKGVFNQPMPSVLRSNPNRTREIAFEPQLARRGVNRYAGQSRKSSDISNTAMNSYTGNPRTVTDLERMLYGGGR